ncbi:MAG: hypothetical protein BM485_16160 [Desulfobulbaceae bacterium DB1]|nr:MAG: hypothetical protein BM485_16160 [Desulfobulbaceae bacterium DB1]
MARKVSQSVDREVKRYLETGEHEQNYSAWPSHNIIECAREMNQILVNALVAEVLRRESGARRHQLPEGFSPITFARRKLRPMVNGLFPTRERQTILDLLEKSLVFLTHDNIEQVLRNETWKCTAWDLANLYLGSIGAQCLDGKPCRLVGLSQETTCYISMAYFEEDDPFADFVVHEAAHVFHNCKRQRVGLPHTRFREWLLQIDFCKRETFAYACEAYGKILERARRPADRKRLQAEYIEKWLPAADGRIDREELANIVAEAAAARNGWKRILARCAPRNRVVSPEFQ